MAIVATRISNAGSNIVRRTVADGTTISGGSLMRFSGDNTASASTVTCLGCPFAGIAVADKLAGDGSTALGCDMGGVWDITNSTDVIGYGTQVMLSGINLIKPGTAAAILSGAIIGTCEESADSGEVVRVRLKGY